MSISSTNVPFPKTMKAEIIDRFGPPEEVMHTDTIPVPELGDDEILITSAPQGSGSGIPSAYPDGVEPRPPERQGITVTSYDGYHGRDALERLNRLIETGPFRVEVSRTYSLQETANALGNVTRHHLGKLAVRVHDS